MNINKASAILLLLLSGCAGPTIDQAQNYATKTSATVETNSQQLELQKYAIDKAVELEQSRILADQAVQVKKIELKLAARKQDEGSGETMPLNGKDIDISHCEEYRDEYPERFAYCMEDEIRRIGTRKEILLRMTPQSVPTISGDNNTVMMSSPGAEINQISSTDHDKESPLTDALVGLINKTTFTPLPQQPVYKHPVAQAIEETKGLAKELAYPILGGVLGWKGLGTLGEGLSKDSVSINGGIVSKSHNPVTTTTTHPQVVE